VAPELREANGPQAGARHRSHRRDDQGRFRVQSADTAAALVLVTRAACASACVCVAAQCRSPDWPVARRAARRMSTPPAKAATTPQAMTLRYSAARLSAPRMTKRMSPQSIGDGVMRAEGWAVTRLGQRPVPHPGHPKGAKTFLVRL
jgi:hypothetical protein